MKSFERQIWRINYMDYIKSKTWSSGPGFFTFNMAAKRYKKFNQYAQHKKIWPPIFLYLGCWFISLMYKSAQ